MNGWLNYHHLLYFHAAAREGSMTAAAKKLRLAQPTLSAQIRQLEEQLGEPLFERRGRRLALTEAGRTVYGYAEEIFGLGRELMQAVHGRPSGRSMRLAVGISDALPKPLVHLVLSPALRLEAGCRLVCRENEVPALLAELAAHTLDLVLADTPVPTGSGVRAYSHLLGDSPITFLAAPDLADRLRGAFPASLDGAPVLLPSPGSALRRALDAWFDERGLQPVVAGEFDDSALMNAFGEGGEGFFAVPAAIAKEVCRRYGVATVGDAPDIREQVWAIVGERRIRHPAVGAVVEAARASLSA